MTGRPYALLVARSLQIADHVAALDYGWQRTGQYRYRTADGEPVMAVADRSDALHVGQSRGTRIYLGPRWFERDDSHVIMDRLRMSGWVEVPLPLPQRGR